MTNKFPETTRGVHGAMLHMAADMLTEGDFEKGLEVIDEVRWQIVELLQWKDEEEHFPSGYYPTVRQIFPCSEPLMRADTDTEIDKYFKKNT